MDRQRLLQMLFSEYQRVSMAWHGHSEEVMSTDKAIRALAPLTTQVLSPLLALRARELSQNIILGRNHRRSA
jgi:hypothetical protein